MRLLYNKN